MPTRQESESKLTMADMGTVHDLIETKGKAGTLAYDFDRAVVEAASTYMADEDSGIGSFTQVGARPPCPTASLPTTKAGRSRVSA